MIDVPSRYQPQSNRASGGMSHATVYRDLHLDREVLVKELQPGVDQRRILDEIAALTAIRSKHVVQIYDVVRDINGCIVGIIEEYIPGEDLNNSIPIENTLDFLRIGYAISCGIADIHLAGRVHRDIKPNNIKFDVEGCLKIFDFGLARETQADNNTQGAVGTLGYMAPELCVDDDEIVHFDAAIDVYAFGATMLKLALQALPRPLRQFPPQLPCPDANFHALTIAVPAEAADVMNGCLAQVPAARPTMADVRDVIGAHLLRNQHRASFVVQGVVHVLHAERRAVTITLPGGVARLSYDGLCFLIDPVSGEIYLNNMRVTKQKKLPNSCVVTFGAPPLGMSRVHVPIDVSHPEVVL